MVQYFSLTPRMFFFLNDDCTFVLFVLCPWALQLEGAKMQGTQPKHFSLATCVSVLHFICQAYGCEIFLDACQSGVVVVRRELTQFQKLL
jgi:hypothetical protein